MEHSLLSMQVLTDLSQPSWVRDLAILLALTLLTYPLARLFCRPLRRRIQGEPPGQRSLRMLSMVVVHVAIWPLVAVAVLSLMDWLIRAYAPQVAVEESRVLPVLGFFLVFRIISALSRVLVSDPRRKARIRFVVLPVLFVLAGLQQIGALGSLLAWLNRPLFHLAERDISSLSVLLGIALLLLFFAGARFLGDLLGGRVLPRMGMDRPLSEALGTVLRYVLIVVGVMVALDTIGFDLGTLQIGLGALGVGIGFGLQDLVQNFASGLILLFERTIKRGDIVSMEGGVAKVLRIGLRSSVVRNRSGHEIVVPNKLLVANPVTNYSLSDSKVRIDIRVGVSYGSDPREVEKVLVDAAKENPELLPQPKPRVLFRNFGDSSIDFELRAWLNDEMLEPRVRSELLFSIWYKLKEAGIEIPFPQRDIHLRNGDAARLAEAAEQPAPENRSLVEESGQEDSEDVF